VANLKISINLLKALPCYRIGNNEVAEAAALSLGVNDRLWVEKYADFTTYVTYNSTDIALVKAESRLLMGEILICPGDDLPDSDLQRLRFTHSLAHAVPYFFLAGKPGTKEVYTAREFWLSNQLGSIEVSRLGRSLTWENRMYQFAEVIDALVTEPMYVLLEDLPEVANHIIRSS
jgi:hypothetical protein